MIVSHLGRPRGLLGTLVGRVMARSNGDFNRWAVEELGSHYQGQPDRMVELGPGPGVGLEAALRAYPSARIWGVDPSGVMLSLARKRNRRAAEAGRLSLLEGGSALLAELAPVDIVMANHVLYFWQQPAEELAQIHRSLREGGLLALGFQLKQNMPMTTQSNFPKLGHLLYDSDEAVTKLVREAGFRNVSVSVKGSTEAPEGRLALATA